MYAYKVRWQNLETTFSQQQRVVLHRINQPMARSKKSTKSEELRIRLSPHYKAKLNSYALSHGKTVSDVIRDYIRRLPGKSNLDTNSYQEENCKVSLQNNKTTRSREEKNSARKATFFPMIACENCGCETSFYNSVFETYLCIECREPVFEVDESNPILDPERVAELDEYCIKGNQKLA